MKTDLPNSQESPTEAKSLLADELHLIVITQNNFLGSGTDYDFKLVKGNKYKIEKKLSDDYKGIRVKIEVIKIEDWTSI